MKSDTIHTISQSARQLLTVKSLGSIKKVRNTSSQVLAAYTVEEVTPSIDAIWKMLTRLQHGFE